VPFQPRETETRRRHWWVPALAAAAILVAAVGGWRYYAGPLPALLVAQITGSLQGTTDMPAGGLWLGPTSRGVGDTEAEVPHDPAAFKMGVQIVNLQVSLQANQGEQAQDVVARILQILDAQMFVDDLKGGYKEITVAISNGTSPRNLTKKASDLAGQAKEALASPLYFDLGQWVEAGRLAAISHNPDFFRQSDNQTFLRRALGRDRLGLKDSKLPQGSRKELETIQQTLGGGNLQPADYAKLKSHFEEILKANYPE